MALTAASPSLQLVPCRFCGRTFGPDVLPRHEAVCTKATLPKRQPFDSFKQRVEGTELKAFASAPSFRVKSKTQQTSPPKSNWRQRHEELISALSNARETKRAILRGDPLPPPPPPSVNPDYVLCKYCGRRFNESAAARHIPFCQSKAASAAKSPSSKTAATGNKSSNAAVHVSPATVGKIPAADGTKTAAAETMTASARTIRAAARTIPAAARAIPAVARTIPTAARTMTGAAGTIPAVARIRPASTAAVAVGGSGRKSSRASVQQCSRCSSSCSSGSVFRTVSEKVLQCCAGEEQTHRGKSWRH